MHADTFVGLIRVKVLDQLLYHTVHYFYHWGIYIQCWSLNVEFLPESEQDVPLKPFAQLQTQLLESRVPPFKQFNEQPKYYKKRREYQKEDDEQ